MKDTTNDRSGNRIGREIRKHTEHDREQEENATGRKEIHTRERKRASVLQQSEKQRGDRERYG